MHPPKPLVLVLALAACALVACKPNGGGASAAVPTDWPDSPSVSAPASSAPSVTPTSAVPSPKPTRHRVTHSPTHRAAVARPTHRAAPRPRPHPTHKAPVHPAGATAICNDGTYSYSQHRQGTCSHHHGVRAWL